MLDSHGTTGGRCLNGIVDPPRRVWGVFTLPKHVGDEGDGDDGAEHEVGLVVARDDLAEAFDAPEEAFDLVAALVQLGVVLPRVAVGVKLPRLDGQIQPESTSGLDA